MPIESATPHLLPARPLLLTTEGDRFFDYCLQPYEPLGSPVGKLRSENLLRFSLDVAGAAGTLEPVIDALQRSCGRDMTVFGVKHEAGRLFWELYFYDPQKEDAAVTARSVIGTLVPLLELGPAPDESIPYFMFSFDLDASGSRRIDGLNLYLAAREVQAGRSYKLTSAGLEFDNIYRFLHPKKEIEKIVHGIKSSTFVDFTRVPLSKVLFPELFTCRRICVAKKRRADGLYYSGIDIDQLLWFLRRFEYPAAILEYVREHRVRFAHLTFDVGLDYRADASGNVRIGKTSFYGTF